MKKGTERVPEENYRLRNEDVYEGGKSASSSFGSKGGPPQNNKQHLESSLPDHKHKDGVFREAS